MLVKNFLLCLSLLVSGVIAAAAPSGSSAAPAASSSSSGQGQPSFYEEPMMLLVNDTDLPLQVTYRSGSTLAVQLQSRRFGQTVPTSPSLLQLAPHGVTEMPLGIGSIDQIEAIDVSGWGGSLMRGYSAVARLASKGHGEAVYKKYSVPKKLSAQDLSDFNTNVLPSLRGICLLDRSNILVITIRVNEQGDLQLVEVTPTPRQRIQRLLDEAAARREPTAAPPAAAPAGLAPRRVPLEDNVKVWAGSLLSSGEFSRGVRASISPAVLVRLVQFYRDQRDVSREMKDALEQLRATGPTEARISRLRDYLYQLAVMLRHENIAREQALTERMYQAIQDFHDTVLTGTAGAALREAGEPLANAIARTEILDILREAYDNFVQARAEYNELLGVPAPTAAPPAAAAALEAPPVTGPALVPTAATEQQEEDKQPPVTGPQ